MSSGFPPKMKMKMKTYSRILKEKVSQMLGIQAGLVCQYTLVEKRKIFF